MAYLTCENLSLGYDGTVVSEGISFEVNRGDYLCIVGENGAGKSTLIKTILQLQKPLSGQIRTGEDLSAYEIGYLPQQTVVQRDFPATVSEIVLSGFTAKRGIRPHHTKREKDIAQTNMQYMNIWDLRKTSYRELSGGQQQRVLLARALCAAGKILLLDEPVTGLDPKVTKEMYELIEKLNKQGITIMMVTHDIKMVIPYASHVLHIGKKQLFFGKKEEYLQSEAWKIFDTKGVCEDE